MTGLRAAKWLVGLLAGIGSSGLLAQSVGSGGKERSPALSQSKAGQAADRNPLPPSPRRPDLAGSKQAKGNETPPSVDSKDIVVTSRPPRGSVVGNVPVERTYTSLDIRAYGSDNVETLIQQIGPQATSDRTSEQGRPLVLLNGRRISSFAEVARIPTEAIERMEILTEEVSLKYGFRPDQKVVNIVTFETFSSRIVQVNDAISTEGGYNRLGASGTSFQINGGVQIALNAELSRTGDLLESDRNIARAMYTQCAGCARTLLPADQNLAVGGTVRSPILNDVAASVSGRYEADTSRTLLGPGLSGPLMRDVSTKTIRLGAALNGHSGRWLWSATGNYDRDDIGIGTKNGADLGLPYNVDSSNALGAIEVLTNGPIVNLPSGAATVSLSAGFGRRSFNSKAQGDLLADSATLVRDRTAFQASLDIPISGSPKRPSAIGRLAANANITVQKLSDFGTLKTFGYGLYWSPVRPINLRLSLNDEERAPAIEQLGAVRIETPNLRSFDFMQGKPIIVTQISGGNRLLRVEDHHTISFSAYAKPLENTDFGLSLDYVKTRVDNPIIAFPIATGGIEAAFPERFSRDADGQLLRIDARPLNFKRSDQSRLRSGISFSRPLGKGPPPPSGTTITGTQFYPNEAAMRAATPPGVTIIEAAPGSDDLKRLDAAASRLTFALYHTLNLTDRLLVQTDGPVLDLLNGSATGFRGGTPRHEIEFQAGIFKSGFGARVTANWRSGTTLRDLPAEENGGIGLLRFSGYATSDLSLFVMPGQRFETVRWLAGTRVTIDINNIFDARPKVTDEIGATPLNYQAAYLDPIGRVVRLSLRKTF